MKLEEKISREAGAGGLAPEEGIIAALSTGAPLPELSTLPSPLNWDYIFTALCDHGLAGFVHRRLERSGIPAPENFRQALSREYWAVTASNLELMDTLKSLVSDFTPPRHPLLLIQGAALLHTLYDDWGLRPMGDVDILVWPEELECLKRHLRARGMTAVADYPDRFTDGGRMVLDLHRHIADTGRIGARALTFRADNAALWEGSLEVEGSGGGIRALGHADNLLALSIHLVKHSFSHLMWAVDILLLFEREGDNLDWGRVIERAREWGALRPLLFTSHFIKGRFGARLPEAMEALLERERLSGLEKALLRSLKRRDPPELFGNLLLSHWAPSLRGKLSLLWESSFPGDTVMKQIFPGYRPGLRPLFLLLRALTLSRIGLREGFRLAKGYFP